VSKAHPIFHALPQNVTPTITSDGLSSGVTTTAVTQSSGHHFIPISATSDLITYERSQPPSYVPVKSNSLAAVSTDLN
ncbi:hypothetical protein IWQ61_005702, partial [Dispira simplex]